MKSRRRGGLEDRMTRPRSCHLVTCSMPNCWPDKAPSSSEAPKFKLLDYRSTQGKEGVQITSSTIPRCHNPASTEPRCPSHLIVRSIFSERKYLCIAVYVLGRGFSPERRVLVLYPVHWLSAQTICDFASRGKRPRPRVRRSLGSI